MWKCRLLGLYYTLRYGIKHFFTTGHILLGHKFKYTDEVVHDHWIMECQRCGLKAGIDEKPPKQ